MLGSTGLFLQSKKRPVLNSNLTPQSLRDSPLGGTGDRIPQPPCVASHCVRIPSTPQSLRDSPLGGTGDRIPQPPCVASHCVRIPSTPQSLRDDPLGGTGKGFPDTPSVASLRVRIPSCAYLQPPSHFVTTPWGARGKDSPIPLLSLRSDGALWGAWGGFYGRDGGGKNYSLRFL